MITETIEVSFTFDRYADAFERQQVARQLRDAIEHCRAEGLFFFDAGPNIVSVGVASRR